MTILSGGHTTQLSPSLSVEVADHNAYITLWRKSALSDEPYKSIALSSSAEENLLALLLARKAARDAIVVKENTDRGGNISRNLKWHRKPGRFEGTFIYDAATFLPRKGCGPYEVTGSYEIESIGGYWSLRYVPTGESARQVAQIAPTFTLKAAKHEAQYHYNQQWLEIDKAEAGQ